MKKLIIVRHGNTFTPSQIPTRAGCHTDLPLVEEQLSKNIGDYLNQKNIIVHQVFAAPLQRTMQTAQLIIEELPQKISIKPLSSFTEVDYGPDENKTEDIVIERLGKKYLNKQNILHPTKEEIIQAGNMIIDKWNTQAIVPFDWCVDVKKIITNWQNFVREIQDDETILVVTSNGIIRFAPHILSNSQYEEFIQRESIKVKTGSISIFENKGSQWECSLWNKRP